MNTERLKDEPVCHHLKIKARWFVDILEGVKKSEIRKKDRDFRVGDFVLLRELEHEKETPTGRWLLIKIVHIVPNAGKDDTHCVFSFDIVDTMQSQKKFWDDITRGTGVAFNGN